MRHGVGDCKLAMFRNSHSYHQSTRTASAMHRIWSSTKTRENLDLCCRCAERRSARRRAVGNARRPRPPAARPTPPRPPPPPPPPPPTPEGPARRPQTSGKTLECRLPLKCPTPPSTQRLCTAPTEVFPTQVSRVCSLFVELSVQSLESVLFGPSILV